jgi:hypothetical protein
MRSCMISRKSKATESAPGRLAHFLSKPVVDQMTDVVADAAGELAKTAVKAVAKRAKKAVARRFLPPLRRRSKR